jgi:hypothetical protein
VPQLGVIPQDTSMALVARDRALPRNKQSLVTA